jgi:O-methyltransferase involved in polyketide biosynthesis
MPVPGFDVGRPNIARVYDYWLGGKDHFAVDREMAARLAELYPPWVQACRDNRAFVERAVTWAARQGIGQFLDLGAGLPTRPAVHEAVRAVNPGARVCYVDNDPVVVRHSAALLAGPDGIAAVEADLTDPQTVWDSPAVRAVIDPGEPVCVIFTLVLHFLDAGQARRVTAGYASRAVPGSALVISAGRNDDPGMWGQVREKYTAAVLHNHGRDEMLSFFAGLDTVPPGITPVHAWDPGMTTVPGMPSGPAYVLGGVAVKRQADDPVVLAGS